MSLLDAEPIIEVHIADAQYEMRTAMRACFRNLDFERFMDYESVGQLRLALKNEVPDLLVVDVDLPGGDICETVQEIRRNALGSNPFVPIISTTWKDDKQTLTRIIDSGVDGLLLKPTSTNTVKRHVDAIAEDRKPFVVTSRYIGPDRRSDASRPNSAALIEAPNTLRAKMRGEAVDQAALDRLIARQTQNVTGELLRRNIFEVSFLVNLILRAYEDGAVTDQTVAHLRRSQELCRETLVRLPGTAFAHLSDLASTFLRVAEVLGNAGKAPPDKERKLLKPLSDALLVGLNPNRAAAELSIEIGNAVSTFMKRQAGGNP